MKKIVFSVTLCILSWLVPSISWGQTEVTVHLNSQTQEKIIVFSNGRMYFQQSNLVIDTDSDRGIVQYAIDSIKKITVDANTTANNEILVDDATITLSRIPNSNFIKISYPGNQPIRIQIFDINGHPLLEKEIVSDEAIDTSFLSAGFYLIKTNGKTLKFSQS